MAPVRICPLPVGMSIMSTGTALAARQMLELRNPFPIFGIDDPGIDLKGGIEVSTEKHDFDDENGFAVCRVRAYVEHLYPEFFRHLGGDLILRHSRIGIGGW